MKLRRFLIFIGGMAIGFLLVMSMRGVVAEQHFQVTGSGTVEEPVSGDAALDQPGTADGDIKVIDLLKSEADVKAKANKRKWDKQGGYPEREKDVEK